MLDKESPDGRSGRRTKTDYMEDYNGSNENLPLSFDNTEEVRRLTDIVNQVQSDYGTANRLKPISAKDLPDIPPPESLWAGLLYPGCITQLNAEPGAGKSTFMYNVAGLGAQGKDFLGIPFSKQPIKTFYFDLESPYGLPRKKIEQICDELPEDFYLQWELNLERDLNHLLGHCKTENYDLLVFDTQIKVLAMEDENSNSEANKAATLLSKLARKTGAAILLIHHTKKGDSGKKVHKGRGASAIAGAVDIVANLETRDSDTLKLEIVKSRIPGVYQSITMRKIGNDKFERMSTEGGNGGSELYRVQDFILSLLSDGAVWRTREIQERAQLEGFKERTIEDALKRLVESGKVIKPQHGSYMLPPKTLACFPDSEDYEDFDTPDEFC